MTVCCVEGCKSNTSKKDHGITFHRLPRKMETKRKWIELIAKPNWNPGRNAYICSLHFEKKCINRTLEVARVKENCFPTIFPQKKRTTQSSKPSSSKRRKMSNESISSSSNVSEDLDLPVSMRVCKICLCVDAKMYHITECNLDEMYLNVLGISPRLDEWLPQGVCWECAARLSAADSFRAKAMLADAVLTGESLNLDEISEIQRKNKCLKSTLAIQNVFKCQIEDYQEMNSVVETGIISIQHNDDIEMEVNELIKFHNKHNELFEECSNPEQDTEVGPAPTEVKIPQQDSDYFEDNNFSDTEYADTNINESINKEHNKNDLYYLYVIPDNGKKFENNEVIKNDDIEDDLQKNGQDDVVNRILKKIKRANMENNPDNTTRTRKRRLYKGSRLVNETMFTIKMLKQEDLVKEVLKRKHSAKYKNAPFKCDVCYTVFSAKDILDRHALRHSEQSGPFQCPICLCRMKQRKLLRKHMTSVHSREYSCKLCPWVSRFQVYALRHLRFHAGKTYECPICLEKYTKETSFQNHLRLKHLSDCVCELCGHTFVNQKGIKAHKKMSHPFDENAELQGPHCEVCDVKFLSQNAYDRHLRLSSKHIQSEDDPYRISNYPMPDMSVGIRKQRKSTRRARRKEPRSEENGDTSYSGPVTCEQCGFELENYRDYEKHFRYVHPNVSLTQYPSDKTPFMCEQCGKLIWYKHSLEQHMLTHDVSSEHLRVECDYCHKRFATKYTLVGHIRQQHMTSPSTSYACYVCGKEYNNPYNVKRHMIVHDDERKPAKCHLCDKEFLYSYYLRNHIDHVHLKKPWPKRERQRPDKFSFRIMSY